MTDILLRQPVAGSLRRGFVLLGGGVAWTLHLLLAYLVGEFGCLTALGRMRLLGLTGVAWTLLVLTVLMLGLALAALGASLRHCRAQMADASDTQRFMGRLGLWLNILFAFIIVFESIPIFFFLESC